MSKVPILFIIFNRPEISLESFNQIRKYQPTELYIAADGPRCECPGDVALCERTRECILDAIDWNCNVHKLFRDKNIGVDFGVYSAINWMFESETFGVVVEDDCFLSPDFFELCESASAKYFNEDKIVHIVANNTLPIAEVSAELYTCTFPMSWGWATWAHKWKTVMDIEMHGIENATYINLIKKLGLLRGVMYHKYWHETFKNRKTLTTWDSIWQYSVMFNGYLSLIPAVNLAINSGIGTSEGTHFNSNSKNPYKGLKIGKMLKPYLWPEDLKPTRRIVWREKLSFLHLRLWGLCKLIRIVK